MKGRSICLFWEWKGISWEFENHLFLILLWFFPVITMTTVSCPGTGGVPFNKQMDYNEVRGYLAVTLAS